MATRAALAAMTILGLGCTGAGRYGAAPTPRPAVAVPPTHPWECPGDHPIKVTADGFAYGPWTARYAQTQAVRCYGSETNAAKAGMTVPITNK